MLRADHKKKGKRRIVTLEAIGGIRRTVEEK